MTTVYLLVALKWTLISIVLNLQNLGAADLGVSQLQILQIHYYSSLHQPDLRRRKVSTAQREAAKPHIISIITGITP